MLKHLLHFFFMLLLVTMLLISAELTFAEILVNITSPVDGSSFRAGSEITLSADVQVIGGEMRDCRFFYGPTSIGKAAGTPQTFVWKNVKSGNYSIYARVRDKDGNQADSDTIQVHVGNISRGDVIKNGCFDYSLPPWILSGYEGGAATATIYNDMYFEDSNYVYIDVTNGSTADWHIQLQHTVPLVPDHTYELWFAADAEAKKTISATFQQNHDPYTVYFSETIEIDGAAVYGPYTFVNTYTDATNLFKFNLGGNELDCFFDQVRIIDRTMTSVTSHELFSKTEAVSEFELYNNYPNPFNLSTSIQYRLSKPANVLLNIYNIQGQLVKTLVQQQVDAGLFTAQWDGADNDGLVMPSGVYIFHLEIPAEHIKLTHKSLLLK